MCLGRVSRCEKNPWKNVEKPRDPHRILMPDVTPGLYLDLGAVTVAANARHLSVWNELTASEGALDNNPIIFSLAIIYE